MPISAIQMNGIDNGLNCLIVRLKLFLQVFKQVDTVLGQNKKLVTILLCL